MIPRLKRGVPVVIEWLDAYALEAGWKDTDVDLEDGCFRVQTAGFFVKRDKDYIRIVQSIGGSEDGVISPFSIPVGCVQGVEEFSMGKKKKDKKDKKKGKDKGK